MKKFLLATLLLAGCAQPPDFYEAPPLFTYVDGQLQPYFDYFTTKTGVQTTSITAGFTSLPFGVAGECVYGNGFSEIRIDANSWYLSDWTNDQKQQLISHELGHCALNLQHINNCSDGTSGTNSYCNAWPLSIMNWAMFTQTQVSRLKYSTNETLYYNALVRNVPINYGSLR